jgi:predicted Holliday junction resolvase-like endonuclease
MFLALLEVSVATIIVLFIFTQLIIPLQRGTRLLPILGSKEAQLSSNLQDAEQDLVERQMEKELINKKVALKKEDEIIQTTKQREGV